MALQTAARSFMSCPLFFPGFQPNRQVQLTDTHYISQTVKLIRYGVQNLARYIQEEIPTMPNIVLTSQSIVSNKSGLEAD